MVEIAWRYNYGERTSATGHGTATESNCRATAGGADGVLDGAGNFAMGQSSRGVIHTGDKSSLTEQVAERPIPQAIPSWLDQLAAPLAQETVSPWTEQVAKQPGQQELPAWLDQLAAPSAQEEQSTWMEQAVEQPLPLVEQRAITMLEDIQ